MTTRLIPEWTCSLAVTSTSELDGARVEGDIGTSIAGCTNDLGRRLFLPWKEADLGRSGALMKGLMIANIRLKVHSVEEKKVVEVIFRGYGH